MLVVTLGCSQKSADENDGRNVELELTTEWKGNSIPSTEVQEGLRGSLVSTHEAMQLRKTIAGRGKCAVRFENIAEKMPDGVIAVGASAKLRCIQPSGRVSVSTSSAISESDTPPPATVAEWSILMQSVLSRLDLRFQVAVSDDRDLRTWLAHSRSAARSQAIAECSTRELRGCASALIERMTDPHPVGVEAIGAVGLLGDEKALSHLVKLTAGEDPEILLAVLYAIESIGGKEGIRYMREIGDTHVVPGVAETAKSLLNRMKEKQ